ncbi:glycoside hydrolase family 99-like domain-containing protein [Pedobacter frigidisoli]|uniref:glycosyltransferase WbsX family protein n=1 Tax=Pedobacter frigidisoli TaxID=2530455 RepID=UPI0029316710|nr:glycoside hydrolase family 99-like domain-containing protein [Pedobacter frigidisoli]
MGEGLAKVRAIAFYLPQYHPIPENNEWWGKGFTEWTNVAKAKPLFKGHYQPHVPSHLGFYDLRLDESREAQANLAKQYGIEGFCYWHYWFGYGRRLLERPFDEVLTSGSPDFPFCLGWANESWSGIWHGNPAKILIEQTYPGKQDYIDHFNYLLTAFQDERYIKVDGKPLFFIYSPDKIPNLIEFTDLFRKLAVKNNLEGLYIVANTSDEDWDPELNGCDAVNLNLLGNLYHNIPNSKHYFYQKIRNQLHKSGISYHFYKWLKRPLRLYKYAEAIPFLTRTKNKDFASFPCIIPNWDNSPRSGLNGLILDGSNPELFRIHLKANINLVKHREQQKRIIFLKSWNEWAEGNHLEPDLKFGLRYLEVLREEIYGHGKSI